MKKFLLLFCLIIVGFLPAKTLKKENQQNSNLPKIAIITTGGTIAEKIDPKTGAAIPAVSGDDLINSVPQLKKMAQYVVINFSNIDSSQMTPEIWLNLSKKVDEVLIEKDIIGAIVTHGTDTMTEGAYFLDISLKTNKPVVFTGAMRAASDPYPDGPPNLINSVAQILSPHSKNWGVTINMNQYINSSRSAEKTQTTNPQTFESGEKGYLGYVVDQQVFRFNDRLYRMHLPRPEKLPKVDIIFEYAGFDGSFIRESVKNGAKGIVVESVGAGNVNEPTFQAIQEAINQGVIVVITSRAYWGSVLPLYGDEGGGESLNRIGAILGGNLRAPKARLLLMLAIPYTDNNHDAIKKLFSFPYNI